MQKVENLAFYKEDKLKLELIRLNPDSKGRKYFERINDEVFPFSERMSFGEIFDFASDTDTDVLGILL